LAGARQTDRAPLSDDFRPLADLVREQAATRPDHAALLADGLRISYGELDALMDRVAAALQRDGVQPGAAVAVAAQTTPLQAALFLGALRAGAVVAPLPTSVTAAAFASMLDDAGALRVFVDASAAALVPAGRGDVCVALDDAAPGRPLADWLAPPHSRPRPVRIDPQAPFNIIYSSGTTGTPKGIVQSHRMRWLHQLRGAAFGYGADSITLLATPLYSNTTLVAFVPAIGLGGTVVLMAKFDAARYLETAERQRATHTILVPVQYQRIMALPQFGRHDLSSFRTKFCTSAPFSPSLKADVVARWPGALIEVYGLTEGGGTCVLEAHRHPDKLHTVGRPVDGHDIRLIDDDGREVAAGEAGEVVGHSAAMMNGYHRQPDKTREAEWIGPDGRRFIRSGDIGRFDNDGFLTLLDRKKDLIISGGFNVYSSDLEAQLGAHPAVDDVAVVGVPSARWGETPVAFVVRRAGADIDAGALRDWLNARVGRMQRLADLVFVDELPRSAIGKILKRELRQRYTADER
jgi:acyl-CoA synthetase (AMP-forming)/AMP-acid ligase II